MLVCIVLLGFLLEKKIGVNQPKRLENARILIANTAMDTDKIKVSLEWWWWSWACLVGWCHDIIYL